MMHLLYILFSIGNRLNLAFVYKHVLQNMSNYFCSFVDSVQVQQGWLVLVVVVVLFYMQFPSGALADLYDRIYFRQQSIDIYYKMYMWFTKHSLQILLPGTLSLNKR